MLVMQSALAIEHGGITYHYALPVMLRHAVNWASQGKPGSRRIDDPDVRRRLARTAVISAVSEGISRRDVWAQAVGRSEERRVGKECVSTCRSRWSPYH